jgi:hypothetical protein
MLVSAPRAGERAAVDALVRAPRNDVYRLALRMIG